MGSPLLVVSHGPPNPRHTVLPGAGPYSSAGGVVASPFQYTANDKLTHCTKWFGPTAPVVSGGTTLLTFPTPSTLRDGPGIDVADGVSCRTESGSSPDVCGEMRRHSGSRSVRSTAGGAPIGTWRSSAERSWRAAMMW